MTINVLLLLYFHLQTHLPGYLEKAGALTSAGAAVIACISVNDAFVMSEWGKANGADGKVRMLADVKAEFTKVRPGNVNHFLLAALQLS